MNRQESLGWVFKFFYGALMMKIFILIGLLCCPALTCLAGAGDKTAWSYDRTGPRYWGDLDSAFSPCGEGREQSPIDLTGGAPADMPALQFDYKASSLEAVNKVHTIQFNMTEGSRLVIGGKPFKLLQFHFHAPSEHTVDGEHYPLEVHLVHAADDGQLAVVGVFFEIREKGRPLMATLWNHLPGMPEITIANEMAIKPADLLPAKREHFRYNGSLTTPPCSEGVLWHVMRQPIPATQAQVDLFLTIVGESNRPVQPLHGRKLSIAPQ